MATYWERPYHEATDGFPADWEKIAYMDESEGYDVDQTAIYKTPTGFALATASGCSCWNGDWEAEEFENLDLLYQSMRLDDRAYNPSWMAAEGLILSAREYEKGAK